MNLDPIKGRLLGIGLGPGDPELLTIKAMLLLRAAPVVAYFAKAGRRGHARAIADRWMPSACEEMPLFYPVTTEMHFSDPAYVAQMRDFYANATGDIAAHLQAGRDVALLCEGDPLFYGSFMHLYMRLRAQFDVIIVPGVTGMSGCWTAAGAPMTWGDDVLTVLPGTLPSAALAQRLAGGDAFVVMKIGRNFAKVRAAIVAAGLLERATYVERASMAGEIIMPLKDKADSIAPYFSLILIPGHGRRP